ncbi:MAG: MotA/TolQ/ExbB proton channel family protein [Deltaproteobacteria bacterium]|nr:MotA/TolQ/ExbB proton channel family protein [Deltaproteobacteria bacterium]
MDPVSQTATETAHAAGSMSLIERYHDGGVFMHPIALVGIIALIIVLERFYTLYVKTSYDKAGILSEVRNAIYSGRLVVVGQTMIHHIIQAGFQAFERHQKDSEVQLSIDAAASKYFPEVEKRTSYLSMLANISTLIGLLGTISGLIASFAGAAKADPNEKATLLAAGISEAMNCTAFGLCVAIPTLLAFAFLQGRTQRIIDDVNEVVLEAMNFVVSHKDKLKNKGSE